MHPPTSNWFHHTSPVYQQMVPSHLTRLPPNGSPILSYLFLSGSLHSSLTCLQMLYPHIRPLSPNLFSLNSTSPSSKCCPMHTPAPAAGVGHGQHIVMLCIAHKTQCSYLSNLKKRINFKLMSTDGIGNHVWIKIICWIIKYNVPRIDESKKQIEMVASSCTAKHNTHLVCEAIEISLVSHLACPNLTLWPADLLLQTRDLVS